MSEGKSREKIETLHVHVQCRNWQHSVLKIILSLIFFWDVRMWQLEHAKSVEMSAVTKSIKNIYFMVGCTKKTSRASGNHVR